MSDRALAVCTFCDRDEDEATDLFAGPSCFICEECVDLCAAFLERERAGRQKLTVAEIGQMEYDSWAARR